ncbi:MAG TPA: Flp pilus assembly protein CpaB [Acidimicrobiales bacterium]|nr:Flp pilus assembly protein CpaB [Acidimicrobiales bacterium]
MRLRHHPWLFWLFAVSLALITGLTVARLLAETASRAERLGGLRDVRVTTRNILAGHRLGAGDVVVRRLPAALLPEGSVAASPAGHTALVPMAPGEVVLEAKLAPWGVEGVAALVPPGRRALAVPVVKGGLALRPGNHVDVLATFETVEGDTEPTFAVASTAQVLDVAEESVTVAVTPEEAARVALALSRGTVTLALTVP